MTDSLSITSMSEDDNKDIQPMKRIKKFPKKDEMKVFLRIRPQDNIDLKGPIGIDEEEKCLKGISQDSYLNQRIDDFRGLKFNSIFNDDCSQDQFYHEIITPILPDIFNNRKSSLIFAYGVTNSGKTHSIMGSKKSLNQNPDGILPRVLRFLIDAKTQIKQQLQQKIDFNNDGPLLSSSHNKTYEILNIDGVQIDLNKFIYLSFPTLYKLQDIKIYFENFEIYNEEIFDLQANPNGQEQKPMQFIHQNNPLQTQSQNTEYKKDKRSASKNHNTAQKSKLKIKQKNKKFYIQDLVINEIDNMYKINDLIKNTIENRMVRNNNINQSSSRSQCCFKIRVNFIYSGSFGNIIEEEANLLILDLAGAERAKKTQNTGSKMAESCHINKTLLCLGNCIRALRNGDENVPYRESKLTLILNEYFVAQNNVIMIVHLHPGLSYTDENINVLKYAAVGLEAKLKAAAPINEPYSNKYSMILDSGQKSNKNDKSLLSCYSEDKKNQYLNNSNINSNSMFAQVENMIFSFPNDQHRYIDGEGILDGYDNYQGQLQFALVEKQRLGEKLKQLEMKEVLQKQNRALENFEIQFQNMMRDECNKLDLAQSYFNQFRIPDQIMYGDQTEDEVNSQYLEELKRISENNKENQSSNHSQRQIIKISPEQIKKYSMKKSQNSMNKSISQSQNQSQQIKEQQQQLSSQSFQSPQTILQSQSSDNQNEQKQNFMKDFNNMNDSQNNSQSDSKQNILKQSQSNQNQSIQQQQSQQFSLKQWQQQSQQQQQLQQSQQSYKPQQSQQFQQQERFSQQQQSQQNDYYSDQYRINQTPSSYNSKYDILESKPEINTQQQQQQQLSQNSINSQQIKQNIINNQNPISIQSSNKQMIDENQNENHNIKEENSNKNNDTISVRSSSMMSQQQNILKKIPTPPKINVKPFLEDMDYQKSPIQRIQSEIMIDEIDSSNNQLLESLHIHERSDSESENNNHNNSNSNNNIDDNIKSAPNSLNSVQCLDQNLNELQCSQSSDIISMNQQFLQIRIQQEQESKQLQQNLENSEEKIKQQLFSDLNGEQLKSQILSSSQKLKNLLKEKDEEIKIYKKYFKLQQEVKQKEENKQMETFQEKFIEISQQLKIEQRRLEQKEAVLIQQQMEYATLQTNLAEKFRIQSEQIQEYCIQSQAIREKALAQEQKFYEGTQKILSAQNKIFQVLSQLVDEKKQIEKIKNEVVKSIPATPLKDYSQQIQKLNAIEAQLNQSIQQNKNHSNNNDHHVNFNLDNIQTYHENEMEEESKKIYTTPRKISDTEYPGHKHKQNNNQNISKTYSEKEVQTSNHSKKIASQNMIDLNINNPLNNTNNISSNMSNSISSNGSNNNSLYNSKTQQQKVDASVHTFYTYNEAEKLPINSMNMSANNPQVSSQLPSSNQGILSNSQSFNQNNIQTKIKVKIKNQHENSTLKSKTEMSVEPPVQSALAEQNVPIQGIQGVMTNENNSQNNIPQQSNKIKRGQNLKQFKGVNIKSNIQNNEQIQQNKMIPEEDNTKQNNDNLQQINEHSQQMNGHSQQIDSQQSEQDNNNQQTGRRKRGGKNNKQNNDNTNNTKKQNKKQNKATSKNSSRSSSIDSSSSKESDDSQYSVQSYDNDMISENISDYSNNINNNSEDDKTNSESESNENNHNKRKGQGRSKRQPKKKECNQPSCKSPSQLSNISSVDNSSDDDSLNNTNLANDLIKTKPTNSRSQQPKKTNRKKK